MEQPTNGYPVYFTDGLYYYKLIGSHESIDVGFSPHDTSASIEYTRRDIAATPCVAYKYWLRINDMTSTRWNEIEEQAFLDVFRTAQGRISKSITRESIAQSAPIESTEI